MSDLVAAAWLLGNDQAAWAEESHTPVPSETHHEILRAKEALQDDRAYGLHKVSILHEWCRITVQVIMNSELMRPVGELRSACAA